MRQKNKEVTKSFITEDPNLFSWSVTHNGTPKVKGSRESSATIGIKGGKGVDWVAITTGTIETPGDLYIILNDVNSKVTFLDSLKAVVSCLEDSLQLS